MCVGVGMKKWFYDLQYIWYYFEQEKICKHIVFERNKDVKPEQVSESSNMLGTLNVMGTMEVLESRFYQLGCQIEV